MIIVFLISITGLMLVHRILLKFVQEFSISLGLSRFILFANASMILFLAVYFQSSPATLWLFIGIFLITLKFLPNFFRFFLTRNLSAALIPLLDTVILNLQTGKSFRMSLLAAVESQSGWRKNQLREIYNAMTTSEPTISIKCLLIKDFTQELICIERSKNRVIDQVSALRRQLKIQESFRRRSGQVTQQIKMQAIIVTALFCALLLFVIKQFGFFQNRFLIFSASLIFIIGLVWIFNTGRRMKWKV